MKKIVILLFIFCDPASLLPLDVPTGSYLPPPITDSGSKSEPSLCRTVIDTIEEDVETEVCDTEQEEKCQMVSEELCNTIEMEVCNLVSEPKCEMVGRDVCGMVDEEVCKDEMEKKM